MVLTWFIHHRLSMLLVQESTEIRSEKKSWLAKWILHREPWVALSYKTWDFQMTNRAMPVAVVQWWALQRNPLHKWKKNFVEETFNKQNDKSLCMVIQGSLRTGAKDRTSLSDDLVGSILWQRHFLTSLWKDPWNNGEKLSVGHFNKCSG